MVFPSYAEAEYWLAAAQLALAMAGMGATLGIGDFLEVFRRPASLVTGLGLQLLVIPALFLAVAVAFGLPPGLTTGFVLVAAVPGGTMSNLFTYLGRGNVPLSISLTAVTTLGCLVTTPAILGLLVSGHLPSSFAMPTLRIMREIVFALLLPLAAGMAFGHLVPARREAFTTWCVRGSLAVIGLIVIGSASTGRVDPAAHGALPLLALLLLPVAAFAVAWAATAVLRFGLRDVVALAVEVTIRNTNLGLLIAASLFPASAAGKDPVADGVFFVALLYGGFALLVATPIVVVSRRRFAANAPDLAEEPEPAGAL